jgi:hypothetical protein
MNPKTSNIIMIILVLIIVIILGRAFYTGGKLWGPEQENYGFLKRMACKIVMPYGAGCD